MKAAAETSAGSVAEIDAVPSPVGARPPSAGRERRRRGLDRGACAARTARPSPGCTSCCCARRASRSPAAGRACRSCAARSSTTSPPRPPTTRSSPSSRKLDDFRGASRFTTWVYKFALLEAGVRVRRRAWQDREVVLDAEGWNGFADAAEQPDTAAERSELLVGDRGVHRRRAHAPPAPGPRRARDRRRADRRARRTPDHDARRALQDTPRRSAPPPCAARRARPQPRGLLAGGNHDPTRRQPHHRPPPRPRRARDPLRRVLRAARRLRRRGAGRTPTPTPRCPGCAPTSRAARPARRSTRACAPWSGRRPGRPSRTTGPRRPRRGDLAEPAGTRRRAASWFHGTVLLDGDQVPSILAAFDLGSWGRLSDGPVATGRVGAIWRLDTERGSWAVKQVGDIPDADLAALLEGAAFQEAAFAAGVPTPAIRRTRAGEHIADCGGVRVRLHAWVDLHDRDVGLDPLALGQLVAALHRVAFAARSAPTPGTRNRSGLRAGPSSSAGCARATPRSPASSMRSSRS